MRVGEKFNLSVCDPQAFSENGSKNDSSSASNSGAAHHVEWAGNQSTSAPCDSYFTALKVQVETG